MISLPQLRPDTNGSPATPNQIAQALTGRPHISWSEIRCFQSCPQKWAYQYLEHLQPDHVSAALLLGIGVHAAIEAHYEAVLSMDPAPSADDLMEVFDRSWAAQAEAGVPIQYSRGQDEQALRDQARSMLTCFQASDLAKPGGQVVGLEEKFKVRLHQELPDLAGRVDLITYDPTANRLWITDFKTARSMWNLSQAKAQAAQLMLYARGCAEIAETLGAGLHLRFIIVTKTKSPKIDAIEVNLDATRIESTCQMVRQVFQAMVAGHTYPSPDPMACSTCGYKRRCPAWSGGA